MLPTHLYLAAANIHKQTHVRVLGGKHFHKIAFVNGLTVVF